MDIETSKRIKAYQKMLPDLKERVIAVALLLAMSASMLTSASFAWITLSRAPEATGMQTTVAANGNLEIALAQGIISKPPQLPEESTESDSSAAEGQTIAGANVTWGNLVNVSDPVYGLSEIALRPALLSDYNRTEYPLNGATYGQDGRVVTTNDRYEYASYQQVPNGTKYHFAAGADPTTGDSLVNYGVRAITSVKYENYSGNARVDTYRSTTEQYYRDAQTYYGKIVTNTPNEVNTLNEAEGVTCINALEGLVTIFAQDEVNAMGLGNGSTKTSCSKYLWYTYQMMLRLQEAMRLEGLALLELANWQAYVASGDNKTENTFTSIDQLTSKTTAQLKTMGVTINCLENYKLDLKNLNSCITGIKPMADKCQNPLAPEQDYYWSDISGYVNTLVDINSTTMAGVELGKISGMGDAMKLLGGGDVIVYKGVLFNVEKRMVNNQNRVKASVKVSVDSKLGKQNVKGTVYTDAGKRGLEPSYAADIQYAAGLQSTAKGEATAKDTYGMAFDLWLRTNYPNAVLTLEGDNVIKDERKTITLTENGTDTLYPVSTIMVSGLEQEVYQRGGKWFYTNSHVEVTAEEMGSQTPVEKYNQIVVGYEGENRIWEDWRDMLEAGYIERDATTQGSGSCFVFYASPTEQPKIMEMLESFNVAFLDQNGDLYGNAKLNLKKAFSNQGKVTVPLEVDTGVTYTDENGKEKTGITTLTQNTPTLITAIVYLNGSQLKNQNVLAKGELQGQLNIQFGTSSTLVAPKNEELASQARTITATVSVNDGGTILTTTNDTIGLNGLGGTEGLEYKASGYPTTVTLSIEGDQPRWIKGAFVRAINETQGTRGQEVDFTPNADGTWTGNFTLSTPGTHVFNTLIVDGTQYTLHDGTVEKSLGQYYPANRPKVYIKGLALRDVTVTDPAGEYLLAEPSKAFKVTAEIDSAVAPRNVNAQFFSDDPVNPKQFTAILTRVGNTNTWEGTANINASGVYTLELISVDGNPLPVPNLGTFDLTLGLRTNVSTTLPPAQWTFDYTGPSEITMIATVFDDGGNAIENINGGVKLYYNNVASGVPMTWNGRYYSGVMSIVQPGQLTFQKLELGTNGALGTLRTANTDAPVFMARSLETPEYVSAKAPSTQTAIGSQKAQMTVTLTDASTATIYAQVQNTYTGETHYIESDALGDTRTFTLPQQNGTYVLQKLYLQEVYDKNWVDPDTGEVTGKWYSKTETTPTEENSYVLNPDAITTEVIADYSVDVYYDGTVRTDDFTINLSGTPENPEGILFQGYSHKELKVVVSDYLGRPIAGVKGSTNPLKDSITKMVIVYDASSDTRYGKYDGASVVPIEVPLTLNADGKTLTADITEFIHSGAYTGTITVNVNGAKETVAVNPTFTVATKKPTATISGATPSGSNPDKITYTTENLAWYLGGGTRPKFTATGNPTSSFDTKTNTATLYAVATVDNSTQRHGTFTQPTLTLNVTGIANVCTASMTLPGGSADAITFSRTGSGTITKTLGKVTQIKSWTSNAILNHTLNAYYGHGNGATINKMTVTRGDTSCTITLDTPIVINNPSSVNQ